ncbi:MAG: hypothetical protein GWP91_04725 [Rhodobacterales bacterium]|nr:hypothetical protein [Rhodobacterales bacterium]
MITGLLIWLVTGAQAQMEVCPGPYYNQDFLTDLDAIDASLKAFEVETARDQMKQVHRMLLCLEELVEPDGIGRLGRQLSLAFFFDQDEEAVRRWGMMSLVVSPDLPWYADMTDDHTLRQLFQEFEVPPLAGPDAVLAPPKKGAIFWNGQLLAEPKAPIEIPGLVQVADKTGLLVGVWWQDGAAFPEDILGPPGNQPSPPKWYTVAPRDPRFAERAALPMFGEAAPEVPSEPKPEIVIDAEVLASVAEEDAPGTYRNPFEDAQRRAIRRETFQTTTTNDAGDEVTLKTEVMTFAREDKSGGKPITYQVFQYWLKDVPEWSRAAATTAELGDAGYLSDWVSDKPPPNASRLPMVWVPYAAAEAYCGSFGKSLPGVDAEFDDALAWEWRTSATGTVRRNVKGKLKEDTDPSLSREDTGFRCIER